MTGTIGKAAVVCGILGVVYMVMTKISDKNTTLGTGTGNESI